MATRLYFHADTYRQNWYPGTYNQGATGIICTQVRYDALTAAYFLCDTLGGYSTDGVNWKSIGTGGPAGALNQANFVYNGVFFVGTTTGIIYRLTSTNGVWTAVFTNAGATQWNDFVYGNGYYVAAASSGVIATSTDGITWTANSSISTIFTTSAVWTVTYSSTLNLFVAAGGSGLLATATNPTGTWTSRTSQFTTSAVYYVVWSTSLSLFIAVGSSGKISTSPDGVTWTAQTSGIATSIYAVAVSGTQIVAGGANATILRSTNGTAWTNARPFPSEVSATTGDTVYHIYPGPTSGEFWAVGGLCLAYKTTDNGVTWAAQGTETSASSVSSDNTCTFDTRLNVLKEMNSNIGTAQVSVTNTISALAQSLNTLWGIWGSRPLTTAATVGGGTITLNTAGLEANAAANWLGVNALHVYVWRPSTGAKVGTVVTFNGTAAGSSLEVSTTETVTHITGIASSAVSALAGDVVICELWSVHTPGMATAYATTFYYDGTTVSTTDGAAATSNASYIEFTENLSFPTSSRSFSAISG